MGRLLPDSRNGRISTWCRYESPSRRMIGISQELAYMTDAPYFRCGRKATKHVRTPFFCFWLQAADRHIVIYVGFTSNFGSSDAEFPLLLRVVGHLSQTAGAASSGGRCPTSLRGGNRGPVTRGGGAFYGESAIGGRGWIERLGSTPLRRSAQEGFRAAVRRLSRRSRRWMGAHGGKQTGHLAEFRCVWSRTSGGRGSDAVMR